MFAYSGCIGNVISYVQKLHHAFYGRFNGWIQIIELSFVPFTPLRWSGLSSVHGVVL